LKHPCTTWSW